MDSRILALGTVLMVGTLTGCGGSGSSAATKTITRTVTATATVTETAEASDTAAVDSSGYTPTKADFTLGVKILSKQCFGSAGCNIEFRIQPAYIGDPLSDSQTTEVTYKIAGSQDEYSNSFTMTGTDASVQETESVSTASSTTKLTAKVTDVQSLDETN